MSCINTCRVDKTRTVYGVYFQKGDRSPTSQRIKALLNGDYTCGIGHVRLPSLAPSFKALRCFEFISCCVDKWACRFYCYCDVDDDIHSHYYFCHHCISLLFSLSSQILLSCIVALCVSLSASSLAQQQHRNNNCYD